MGKQKKTVRNKRKIKVADYENDVVDTKDAKKQISKTFSRELKITIVSIFVVTIVMISSAFAIFSSVQKSEKYNTLTVGTLKVDFIDTEDGMGNIINLNGAYPISDAKGQEEDPYSFKITNSGTLAASYKIKILDDTDMINEDNCQDNLLDKSKVRVSINKGEAFTLSDVEASGFTVEQGTLEASDVKNYEIRIWIKEDSGNEVLGKHYHGKIVVEGVNTKSATKLCKRATTLHKETCENTDTSGFCQADGYSLNSVIEYGSLGVTGTLTSGDAFDCDVNGDGVYNEVTERFYYLGDLDNDTAMLIYYSNVDGSNPTGTVGIAYDESGKNNNGPVTAIKKLPTVDQWSNVNLKNISRTITNEIGTNIVSSGSLPSTFSYNGYAARLLTIEDIRKSIPNYNTFEKAVLQKYNYFMESTQYSSNDKNNALGYWLENALSYGDDSYRSSLAMLTIVEYRGIYSFFVDSIGDELNGEEDQKMFYGKIGVRPVIEVAKSNISY